MNDCSAIILAAGRGSRINEYTKKIPKGCIKIFNKSLIDRQIDIFIKSGINDIYVVTGYKSNLIKNVRIKKKIKNDKWQVSNMVYSLYCADKILSSKTTIVSYSDIFFSNKIINKLKRSKNDFSVAFDKNFLDLWKKRFQDPFEDLESFIIDSKYNIKEIGKKISNIKNIQGQYMGITKFTPLGWKIFKKIIKPSINTKIDFTSALNLLIKNSINIRGYQNNDIWGEIDSKSDLLLYEKIYKNFF